MKTFLKRYADRLVAGAFALICIIAIVLIILGVNRIDEPRPPETSKNLIDGSTETETVESIETTADETTEIYFAGDHDGDIEDQTEVETVEAPTEYIEPYTEAVVEETTVWVEPETEVYIEPEVQEQTPEYVSATEWEWFIRCVSAEEGGSYLRSWYAASCILNRADYEGKTIIEVISAPGQFAVYTSGVMWEKEPTQNAIDAVNAVLNGDRNYEVYYFASYDAHSGYARLIDIVDGEHFYARY